VFATGADGAAGAVTGRLAGSGSSRCDLQATPKPKTDPTEIKARARMRASSHEVDQNRPNWKPTDASTETPLFIGAAPIVLTTARPTIAPRSAVNRTMSPSFLP
jgi:hypothetical protein